MRSLPPPKTSRDTKKDCGEPAAHPLRLAQIRIIALLDRRVEGVHVDMDDLAMRRR